MLEQGHHDTINPTNNNHDINTDHDNNDTDNKCVTNQTVSEENPEEMVDVNS
jgi:hypothetical protein